jgi:uncharacterized protein (TIGR01777 family)
VGRLVRGDATGGSALTWDPDRGRLEATALAGFDAVVHLAGENIANRRWTAAQKRRIRDSRVEGTRLLCRRLSELPAPPKVLVAASAVGYYGCHPSGVVDEGSPAGTGFLAEVCQAWEASTEPARSTGIRVVNLRLGLVLSRTGGALAKMLLPFRLGLGGKIGSGSQLVSWIAIDDVLGAIDHCLTDERLAGPVNATAPAAVTNAELTRTLGKVLHRPTVFPMPAFAARLAFGEMADELLLSSIRAIPLRLGEHGYMFEFPILEDALRHILYAPRQDGTTPVGAGTVEHRENLVKV